ncbi:MAG TPA: hypothetical protein VE868_04525 [Balneolaceae bacterium]|nr:hypothetical protein [Balneolaceae bacterium]
MSSRSARLALWNATTWPRQAGIPRGWRRGISSDNTVYHRRKGIIMGPI